MADTPRPSRSERWHGWAFTDRALHVGPLPGRKRVALYQQVGGVVTPLAYFTDEAAAREAMALVDRLSRALIQEEPS